MYIVTASFVALSLDYRAFRSTSSRLAYAAVERIGASAK